MDSKAARKALAELMVNVGFWPEAKDGEPGALAHDLHGLALTDVVDHGAFKISFDVSGSDPPDHVTYNPQGGPVTVERLIDAITEGYAEIYRRAGWDEARLSRLWIEALVKAGDTWRPSIGHG